MKVLCLLSNILGNKVLSTNYRKAIDQIAKTMDLEVVYEYLSKDDFHMYPAPFLFRKSNIVELMYVAGQKFKRINFASFDLVVIGCFEFLWVLRQSMELVPVVTFLDTTPIAARRMLVQRLGTTRARFKGYLVSACFRVVFGPVFRKVTLFLPTSPWCGRSLVEDFKVEERRVKYNYPALDLSFWRPGDMNKKINGPLRLLFVGNDFMRKGGMQLLDIFSRLEIKASLIIISNDSCLSEMILPEGVQLLRNVSHDEIPRYFMLADLFVFPTMHDQLPLVVTEAMACGTPVLANNVGALADFISSGVNGILFKPNSTPEEWISAITTLSKDTELLINMSINARCTANENFSEIDFVRNVKESIVKLTYAGK